MDKGSGPTYDHLIVSTSYSSVAIFSAFDTTGTPLDKGSGPTDENQFPKWVQSCLVVVKRCSAGEGLRVIGY